MAFSNYLISLPRVALFLVCKVGSHGKMKCEKEILPLQALKTGLCSPPKGKGNLDEGSPLGSSTGGTKTNGSLEARIPRSPKP
ncbi:hypothetical protein PVK06_049940 [Gossypium arboreum]|uniref:Uncharacterized protein n=1 Tax=Gossypium arboreum TaxID=29729 RepID=A0ABR0M9H9_GOSAR|nr:hypothetical protein PVK06_049940 [Gossypium arboreum]